ncbi:MAG: flagellar hook-basal body complex protein [Proteobacteria bacterium]|nr:flagellar hook-basal body complex protein [Pseudomonadota bacterium]
MGSPTSSLQTFVSGAMGYSSRFDAHAQNSTAAGVLTAKKRETFLTSLVSEASANTFTPAGIQTKPVMFIESAGSIRPVKVSTFLSVKNPKAFFIVNENTSDSSPGKFSITRLGTFKADADGYLKSSAGSFLKGVYTDKNGVPLVPAISNFSQLKTINVKNLSASPVATSNITINYNLPGNSPVYNAGPPLVGEYEIGTKVYDSLGIERDLKIIARRQANNPLYPNSQVWRFTVTSPDATGVGAISAPYATGFDIVFDGTGKPSLINGGVALPALQVVWNDAAVANSTITLNVGTIGQEDGMTVGGKDPIRKNVVPNGRPGGTPEEIEFDPNGYGWVKYNNGAREIFCRIPFATVNNVDGLTEVSGNAYVQSQESGGYKIYYPNEAGMGPLSPASVEDSTINTAEVFTEMIVDSNRFVSCLKGIGSVQKLLEALDRINP